jgi:hypothetical protein
VGDNATPRRRRPGATDQKFRCKYKSCWKLREEKGRGEAGLGKVGERPLFFLPLLFCCQVDLGLGWARGGDGLPREAMPGRRAGRSRSMDEVHGRG